MTTIIRPVTAATTSKPPVVVYDANASERKPLSEAQVSGSKDKVLKEAAGNASTVMDFLKKEFGRDGLDGRGQQLAIVVHAPEPGTNGAPMSNAFWDGNAGRMYIGDGDGREFTPLGGALDVVGHETGHAILESEVDMGFNGQEGALHEHFGDVIGSLVDADDWQIGEDVFTPGRPGDALRDMAHPTRYKHMDQVRGPGGEPHDLADIPNLVAVRVAEKVGRESMGQIWYDGFTEYLKDHAKFADAATATVKAATELFGKDSSETSAVTDAWESVGVLKAA